MAYKIANWDSVFERSSDQKRVKGELRWVAIPTKHDSYGFRRIMAEPDGPAIYGAWCLIVQVAAKCPERGVLARSDGRAITSKELALITGADESVFRRAFECLSDPEIGWILGDSPEISGDSPEISGDSPHGGGKKRDHAARCAKNSATVQDSTIHNSTGQNHIAADAATSKPSRPREPNPLWDALAAVFYPTGVPPGDAKMLGGIVRDLKAMEADPSEIPRRCERYLATFTTALTIHALKKNWNVLSESECAKRTQANQPDHRAAKRSKEYPEPDYPLPLIKL